jgi:hypothetical protein
MSSAQRGIADLLVPARHWQLGRQDRGTHPVTIFADLPEVTAFGFCQRSHGPVVDHKDIDPAEPGQQTARAAIGRLPSSRRWPAQGFR